MFLQESHMKLRTKELTSKDIPRLMVFFGCKWNCKHLLEYGWGGTWYNQLCCDYNEVSPTEESFGDKSCTLWPEVMSQISTYIHINNQAWTNSQ